MDGCVKKVLMGYNKVHFDEVIPQLDGLENSDLSDTEVDVEESSAHKCSPCDVHFLNQSNLTRHKIRTCPHQPGIDPIELSLRRKKNSKASIQNDSVESQEVIESVTIYKINKELEKYVNSCSDSFSKYQVCENLKQPITVSDFWPILLDYRGNETLKPLHGDICSENGFKVLYPILADGYNYYGISSITIKKEAYVLKDDQMYPVSQYRSPSTHLQLYEKLRPDRPIFMVENGRTYITISLHPVFLQILPTPCISNTEDQNCDDMSEVNSQDFFDDGSRLFLSEMFSQVSLKGEGEDDDDDSLSQPFSQVSLGDKHQTSQVQSDLEPISKKIRLDREKENIANVSILPKVRLKEQVCAFCGKIIAGGLSKLNRHQENSCSAKPGLSGIELLHR